MGEIAPEARTNPSALLSVIRSSNVTVGFESCCDALTHRSTHLLYGVVGYVSCCIHPRQVSLLADVNFYVSMLIGFYAAPVPRNADMDDHLTAGAARYLRAWQLEATLRDEPGAYPDAGAFQGDLGVIATSLTSHRGAHAGLALEDMDLVEAAKIGVAAAKEVGVTITGALDDALASMLGGVVVTDNREMRLLKREEFVSNIDVMLLVPDRKLFSKDTDVKRSRLIAPLAEVAFDLAMEGDYYRAMILNGFAYCGALGLSTEPMLRALEAGARGVSLSGTGPSYAALIDEGKIDDLEAAWRDLGGRVIRTKVNNRAASIGRGV